MNEKEASYTGIRGIVVTHGRLAAELVNTVELVVGKQSELFSLSGSDAGQEALVREIRKLIDERGRKPVILFVDYFGGSCCINCVRAAAGDRSVKILSGVNLPVLLSFVTKRDSMDFDQLVDHLIRRGRESIRLIGP